MKWSTRIYLLLVLAIMISVMAGCGEIAESVHAQSAAPSTAEAPDEVPDEALPLEIAPTSNAEEQPAESVNAPEPAPVVEETDTLLVLDLSQQPSVQLPLSEEGAVLSIWCGSLALDAPIQTYQDNRVIQEWQERTGVTLQYTEVPSPTLAEQFNLMLASQEYADILSDASNLYTGGAVGMVADEITLDLTDLIAEDAVCYSWLLENDSSFAQSAREDNGKIAAFYGYQYNNVGFSGGMMTRADWLEALNIDVPQTYDEFHDMLSAYKNAGFSTYPLSIETNGSLKYNCLEAGFGVRAYLDFRDSSSCWYVENDDTVQFGYMQPAYREYVLMMREWYAEGLISPDLLVSSMLDSARILDGTYSVFAEDGERMVTYEQYAEDSTFKLTAIPPLRKNTEEKLHNGSIEISTSDEAYVISTACADPALAVRMLDYLYSYDGMILCSYGIQGESYELSSAGQPVFTEFILNNPDGMTFTQLSQIYTYTSPGCLNDKGKYKQVYTEDQIAACETWASAVEVSENNFISYWSMTTEERELFASSYSDVTTYVSEIIPKFILGELDMDQWDSYVSTVEELGIKNCTDALNSARARYNAR